VTAHRRRLSTCTPPAPFVAGATLTRLTFMEVEGREPVCRGLVPTLAVVVWPMQTSGRIDPDAIVRGEAVVTTWTPTAAELARLLELIAAGWDLAGGDVLVGGGRVIPQLETMRQSEYMPTGVGR
jgi:hypothetical protein